MESRFTQDQIDSELKRLADWTQSGDDIERTFEFKDFKEAMRFVNRVAELAEKSQHHPDVLIRYNRVTLTLTTHESEGLTRKDFECARGVEGLLATSKV